MANKEYLKMLEERDKAMPMGRFEFKHVEAEPIDLCGACDKPISPQIYVFCPYCGQRIGRETYKL